MISRTMTFQDTQGVTGLRERIRSMIQSELTPEFLRGFVSSAEWQREATAFCKRLARERLLTFAWSQEYGGAGATKWEQTALREEFWAHHEPRGAQYMGVNWVGPVIMHFGTDAQKHKHLPEIAAGEEVWCQGFSEPEVGSDLASLQLSATRQADGSFRANGQKIWTSYATMANWCFLATRTRHESRKHQGITIFLVPMDREGITVRPIDSIIGPNHLNEVFFDGVVLHEDEILGELDKGWDVIDVVLKHERVGIARYARSDKILADLWPVVQAASGPGAAELRAAHARELVQARVARLLSYRTLVTTENGDMPTQPSVARIASTLLDQRVADLAMETAGADAVDASEDAVLDGSAEDAWRYARSSTIASGTTEIQRLLASRAMVDQS
ncbi:MAG TPA: acyl-CoA dehydrogenase family protein [Solirubrobacteraceae bacterium]|jgi:alkylation response protein AidB-like acyl-CoA dehydrogenase|nr:acyl-CoA dehydrogenase family protein [Solirubrobacteraceae bacterium]